MINPRLLMQQPTPVDPKKRQIAHMIMSGAPLNAPQPAQAPPMFGEPMQLDPSMQGIFDELSPADQMLFEDEYQRGVDPKELFQMFDPTQNENPGGMFYQEDGRFNDAASYQVADAGPMQPPAFGAGEDAVLGRQMAGEEMNFRSSLSRLDNIDAMLRENEDLLDSLTFSGDMRRRFLGLKDKFGFDLGEQGEDYLTNSTVFRQNILRNINRTIQEVTGAQMGEEEAKRIRAEMPDVDAGPVEFKAKLSAAMNMIRMDVARVSAWRRQGGEGDPSQISDTQLRQMMQESGRQFYDQALSAGMSPSDARMEAARLLGEEFGI